MTVKTTLTPAEHANVVQGMTYPLHLGGRVAAPTSGVLFSMIVDGPYVLRNLRTKIGTGGSAGTTTIIAKKNAVAICTITAAHTVTDPDVQVVKPADDAEGDALSSFDPGDVLTIECGTAATDLATLDVSAYLDRRFS